MSGETCCRSDPYAPGRCCSAGSTCNPDGSCVAPSTVASSVTKVDKVCPKGSSKCSYYPEEDGICCNTKTQVSFPPRQNLSFLNSHVSHQTCKHGFKSSICCDLPKSESCGYSATCYNPNEFSCCNSIDGTLCNTKSGETCCRSSPYAPGVCCAAGAVCNDGSCAPSRFEASLADNFKINMNDS